jgi:hypothetical protein
MDEADDSIDLKATLEAALKNWAEIPSDLSDVLHDLIWQEAEHVLTLNWSGGGPAHSGTHWVGQWNGLYFFFSDDGIIERGPFDSVQQVLTVEELHWPTPQPELDSGVISLECLLKIARDLVTSDGDVVRVNDKPFVLSGGELVEQVQASRP